MVLDDRMSRMAIIAGSAPPAALEMILDPLIGVDAPPSSSPKTTSPIST